MRFAHLNLTVADIERSLGFYGRWFGFDRDPQRCDDETVMVRDADGFDLALRAGAAPSPPAPTVHVGFRCADPSEVRVLRRALVAAGVPLVASEEEPTYVGLKCLDPDGYEIEVYWEP